jgi:hypothetical protein
LDPVGVVAAGTDELLPVWLSECGVVTGCELLEDGGAVKYSGVDVNEGLVLGPEAVVDNVNLGVLLLAVVAGDEYVGPFVPGVETSLECDVSALVGLRVDCTVVETESKDVLERPVGTVTGTVAEVLER